MQSLTAPPRDHLTADQVRDILTADSLTVATGLELLDDRNRMAADISGTLADDNGAVGGSVRWDNRAAVHGSCNLQLLEPLRWGRDRIRPYMVLTAGDGTSARFNLGVYVPTQPTEQRGETPTVYDVTCYGLMTFLQGTPGDTWVVTAGTTYYDALAAIVTASGIGAPLLLPGELRTKVLPATRVWALFSPGSTWLRMMTDLLFEVGYTAPWMDENGAITARPTVPLAERAVEWVADTRQTATTLIHPSRQLAVEADDIPNWWRYVWSDKPGTPIVGNGIHIMENLTSGDSSQEALGRVIRKTVFLQAESHAALVAQAEKLTEADMAAERTFTLSIDPLPIMGFDDCIEYVDTTATGDVVVEKLVTASWELHFDGSPGALQLGGAPREPLDEVETGGRATVAASAPLRVVVDGAETASFANALDGATYSLGDRVTVTIRNPLPPLILGIES